MYADIEELIIASILPFEHEEQLLLFLILLFNEVCMIVKTFKLHRQRSYPLDVMHHHSFKPLKFTGKVLTC